jgi:hypothetical protein
MSWREEQGMTRYQLMNLVSRRLKEIGIPDHLRAIRFKPAAVVVDVLINGKRYTAEMRSGLTFSDIEFKLGTLEGHWLNFRHGQRDIEDGQDTGGGSVQP